MSIVAFCDMERFDYQHYWESEAEKEAFLEIKENLKAFIETKKEELHLGIFGEQLLEPVICELVMDLMGKKRRDNLLGIIQDQLWDSHFAEIIKNIVNFVEDLEDVEIYQRVEDGWKSVYMNDTNRVSYQAASDIVYYIIQAKYYQMQFQLLPIMEEYKSLVS